MTTPLSGGTPYVTPYGGLLDSQPTGVDFTTIPPSSTATPATKTAAVYNICRAATSQANGYVGFPLHSVINTEYLQGPNYRATVQNSTGNGRLILQRWPVTQILAVSVSPNNTFPRQYTALPAGSWDIEVPVLSTYNTNTPSGSGEGGQAILIAPGYMSWALGRWGFRVQIQYIHGWPHTELSAAASAGDGTLSVKDITAWGPASGSTIGTEGTVYDVSGNAAGGQESVHVSAAAPTSGSTQAGPGTLTLASPLQYSHAAGITLSSLPNDAIWATALFTASIALTRGATATTLRAVPGGAAGEGGAEHLANEAELILRTFKATI